MRDQFSIHSGRSNGLNRKPFKLGDVFLADQTFLSWFWFFALTREDV